MEMKMTLGPVLEQKVKLEQEAKIEIEHKLTLNQVQRIGQMLRDLRNEVDPDDQRLASGLDQTFAEMAKVLDPEQVALMRESLRGLFLGKEAAFIEGLLANSSSILFDGKAGIKGMTARLASKNLTMSAVSELKDLSEGDIREVLLTPERVSKRAADMQSIITGIGVNQSTGNAVTELARAKRLLSFYESYKEHFSQVVDFIELVAGFPSPTANPLRRAMVDLYMLDRAGYLASDRLLKRFAAVFSRRKSDLTFEKLNVGAANIIGEYMLVGMGVIDPEIFKLMKGENKLAPEDEIVMEPGERKKVGELISKYGLHEGKFVYNRYATLMVRPGMRTDKIIRDFLTNDVRGVRAELCTAVKLQNLIDGYLENLENMPQKEAGERLMTSIGESLASRDFLIAMAEIVKSKLLPKLVQVATGKTPSGSGSAGPQKLPHNEPPRLL